MRFHKYNFFKSLSSLLLFLYINFRPVFLTAKDYADMSFTDVFFMRVYGSGIASRDKTQTMVVISGLLFVVLCNCIFSNYFYKDLHVSSIYSFTRNNNRLQWLINRSIELAVYVFIYMFVYVMAGFAAAAYVTGKLPGKEDFVFVVTVFLAAFLYSYFSTFFINVLAIGIGSGYSFFSVMVLQGLLAEIAIEHEHIPFLKLHPQLLKLNPVANIICTWEVSGALSMFIYYAVLVSVLFFGCYVFIRRKDIGIENKEI